MKGTSINEAVIGYSSSELDTFADVAASAMGVSWCADLGAGADGIVYMLEDGGCMKLTTSRAEAALAAMLIERRVAGTAVSGVPLFHDVIELDGAGETPLYAIVREGVESAFPDPTEEEMAADRALMVCLRYIAYAWTVHADSPENYYLYGIAMEDWGTRKPSIEGVLPALRTLRDDLGVTVRDLHYDNFGVSDSGILCVRDFSRIDMARDVLETALSTVRKVVVQASPAI